MYRGKSGAFIHYTRPSDLEADLPYWKQAYVHVAHPAGEQELVRRIQNRDIRVRRWRVQRVGEQVVVEDVLVALEIAGERIERALGKAQVAHIDGIAAVAEVAEAEIIKKLARVAGRGGGHRAKMGGAK